MVALGPMTNATFGFSDTSESSPFRGVNHQFSRVVHAPLELMITLKEHQLLAILFQEPVRWTKKQGQRSFKRYASLNRFRHSDCRAAYHR